MKKTLFILYVLIAVILLGGGAFAQTPSKCFVNGGLKDETRVYLTINGAKVTGEFLIERDYQSENTETFAFSGTKSGKTVTVKFTGGKTPDDLPPNIKRFAWTLITTAEKESLRIKLYGKNYETGKFSVYSADFESCEPSYAALVKTAKRVSFAKGASSANVSVSLESKSDRKGFLLNLRKGQKFSVEAIGCGISFYYPNKTLYEEGTAIDTWGSDSLAQSGDYLFVISPAGEPGNCNVIFKTN